MIRAIPRIVLVLPIVVLVAAAAVAVTALRVDAGPRTITVVEPLGEGAEAWFDIGDDDAGPGADIGDVLLEHKPLVDPDDGSPAGMAVTRVQVVDLPDGVPTFIIDCTLHLVDGDVVFYGAGSFGDLGTGITFAVTGGSGAYDRASGTATVTGAEDGVEILLQLRRP